MTHLFTASLMGVKNMGFPGHAVIQTVGSLSADSDQDALRGATLLSRGSFLDEQLFLHRKVCVNQVPDATVRVTLDNSNNSSRRLYAVSITVVAVIDEEYRIKQVATFLSAESIDEAIDLADQMSKEVFPEGLGHVDHKVVVVDIPEQLVVEVANSLAQSTDNSSLADTTGCVRI